MISMDSVADALIRRQVLREIRRSLLGLIVSEAAEYRVTLATVINGLLSGDTNPHFARQFDEFMRTVGIPREIVLGLSKEFAENPRDDWEIEDLQVLVNGFARQTPILQMQAEEVLKMAKRVAVTAKRREQQQPKMDALVRQARGIPEGEIR